jgi:hypothetical protein
MKMASSLPPVMYVQGTSMERGLAGEAIDDNIPQDAEKSSWLVRQPWQGTESKKPRFPAAFYWS